jgi:hypothetical protein
VGAHDRFENGLDAALTVTGPEPNGQSHAVPMPQTAPGRYEADFPLDRYGSFLLHASLAKPADDETKGKPATVAESYGHVTNAYPREFLALAPDVATLTQAVDATGGALDPSPARVFDAAGEVVRYHEDLWPRFAGAAIVVFLVDLLVRRVRLFDRKRTARPAVGRGRALA